MRDIVGEVATRKMGGAEGPEGENPDHNVGKVSQSATTPVSSL